MDDEEIIPETAVMLKGLHRQNTVENLQSLLNRMGLRYDFLYVPWDSRHNHNVGLAFINFVEVAAADRCLEQFTAMLTSHHDMVRMFRTVSKYHVHGVANNLAFFLVSAGIMAINHEHAPLVFDQLGQPISLRKAVAELVTMQLLLKALDLKVTKGQAARSGTEASSPGTAGADTKLVEAVQSSKGLGRSSSAASGKPAADMQSSKGLGRSPSAASGKPDADRVSLPRNAGREVAGRDGSGGVYHQLTGWQARDVRQQPQPTAPSQYLAGSSDATPHPQSHGTRFSQNYGLVEQRLPQSVISQPRSSGRSGTEAGIPGSAGADMRLAQAMQYSAGSPVITSHPDSNGISISQNNGLIGQGLPHPGMSHPSYSGRNKGSGTRSPHHDSHHGPNSRWSEFRVGDQETIVFEF